MRIRGVAVGSAGGKGWGGWAALGLGLAAALVLGSCVQQRRTLTPEEEAQRRQLVSDHAPERIQHTQTRASFERKVEFLGYDADKEEVRPGETITVSWYWKCIRPVGEGWRLFTHVTDENGGSAFNQDGVGIIRDLYPPGEWRAGEVIRDVQAVTVPADWRASSIKFFIGVWMGPNRLEIVEGPRDNENRLPAATFRVGGAPLPLAVPALGVPRATSPIQIDGRTDEAAWGQAARILALVHSMSGVGSNPQTAARVLWDDQNLYVAFELADDHLYSTYRNHDEQLWNQDVAEIMIDPDGDGRDYYEFQVSPAGVTFDTFKPTAAPPRNDAWESRMRAAVSTRGTVNEDGDTDAGWTAEIAIPFAALDRAPRTPPQPGDVWRANFYRLDVSKSGAQSGLAWSPPRVGNFHTPARFGRLEFRGPVGTGAGPALGAAPLAPGTAASPSGATPAPRLAPMPAPLATKLLKIVPPPRPAHPPAKTP